MRERSLTALSTFLAVAERHSFSAAGAALGISRSAVSQAVRALEEQVGTPLLVRTTRSVRLTDAGARLAASAGPALRQADDALLAVKGGERAAGTLRLTVPHICVPTVITPLLPALRSRHPDLAIEIVVDDRMVDIVADGFDAGIRLGEAIERDMVGVRISAPFRFVVVASPGYLKKRGTPQHPRDLVEHDCIGYRGPASGVLYRWEFERRGREFEIQVPSSVITTDATMMVSAARAGLGFGYVDELTAERDIAAGRLVVVLEEYLPRSPGFFLYFPHRSRNQPKLRALIDLARAR
jgi:DNA-binding transcriptional LysR family regulator